MYNLLYNKKIFEEINSLKKYEDKIIYLIELGKILPLKNKNIKYKNNIIYGCQNNVWLKIKNNNNIIKINADSDSLIIKGILSIIIINLNNKKIKYIKNKNIYNIFKKIHFFKKIINNKIIGLKSIFFTIKKKIKNFNI